MTFHICGKSRMFDISCICGISGFVAYLVCVAYLVYVAYLVGVEISCIHGESVNG